MNDSIRKSSESLNTDINTNCERETSQLIIKNSKTRQSNSDLLVSSTNQIENQNETPNRKKAKCPTCNGTGNVNKDEEHKLVALIPLDDKRLKPKRIWLWILITVIFCSMIAITITFLFVPRTIHIKNEILNVEPFNITYIYEFNSTKIIGIVIDFDEQYVIQNDNFYPIEMNNLTLELTRISHVTTPDLDYQQNIAIPPRKSKIIDVRVKYVMYIQNDPYTDLCIKNIINQLFALITTSFSFSTFWNSYEQNQIKTMQYLTCYIGNLKF